MAITITPKYKTKTFKEVYSDYSDFISDIRSATYFPVVLDIDSCKTLYYLLLSRYCNNPIANDDVDLFKIKLASIVYQFGGAWKKKLEVQAKILALTDEDLEKGSTMIYNHAFNPDSEPSTEATDTLAYINDQNVNTSKKSKIDAYGVLWGAIRTDVTKVFLDKFKVLFRMFVMYDYMEVSEDE